MPNSEPRSDDLYAHRLARHLPPEVLGGFVALAGLARATGETWAIVAAVLIGLISTPGYHFARSLADPSKRAPTHFYVLSAVTFLVWALAISAPVRDLLQVTEQSASFLLAATIFVLPMLDMLLERVLPRGGRVQRRKPEKPSEH